MIAIDFTPTFKNIKEFRNRFNEQFIETIPSNYGKIPDANPDDKGNRNDVASMLRNSHEALMQHLVKIFSAQLNEAQAVCGPYQYLPALRTNNGVIASALGVTKKTVINLMERLGPNGAGFILGKRFRGSTHDYEIKLNVSLFRVVKKGLPAIPVGDDNEVFYEDANMNVPIKQVSPKSINRAGAQLSINAPVQAAAQAGALFYNNQAINNLQKNQAGVFQKNQAGTTLNNAPARFINNPPVDNPKITPDINTKIQNQANGFTDLEEIEGKKFPHKDKDNSFKKYNNTAEEIVRNLSISDLFFIFKGNTPNQKSVETRKISTTETVITTSQKKETLPAAGGAGLSTTIQETPSKLAYKHQNYMVFLHNLMYTTIFSRQAYHAPTQVEAAKQYLRNEFLGLDDHDAAAKYRQLKIRIILAHDWMKKGDIRKKDGTTAWTRYIPIPATYLNPLNFDSGFINTLIWHDKFVENRRNRKKMGEMNDQITDIFERWDLLNRALDYWMKNNDYNGYKTAKNHLKKKNPELVYAFDMMAARGTHRMAV